VTEADLIRFVNAQAEVYSQVISAAGCMARPYESRGSPTNRCITTKVERPH
jgi:hypothetical protein